MSLVVLGLGWIVLAGVVSPFFAAVLARFAPCLQAAVAFVACVCLAAIPAAVASILLARDLSGPGPVIRRCGALLSAVVADPLARPRVTLPLASLVAGVLGLGLGLLGAWRSQSASRRLAVAERGPLVTVASADRFAFTAGLLFPRVVISEGLVGAVPTGWCRIVLAHEEAHRRGRHPLLLFVVESLARGLPLVPLRWGADAVRLALEFVADDHALAEVGTREDVAEAIAGMALAPAAGTASFEGHEVWRCRRLLDPPGPAGGLAAAGLLVLVVGVAALAGGHALHCAWASADALAVRQCRLM